MFLFFYLFIFLFGLAVGSFLNCVIYRLARPNFSLWKNLGGLTGRSYCPKCKHQLNWYDLMPIFSYILLFGKCRYCKKSISLQYPLVEIATALLFLLIFNFSSFAKATEGQAIFNPYLILNTLYLLLTACFLIIIFVYDLKHYIIPDKIVFSAIGVALVYNLFRLFTGDYSLSQFLNMIYAGFWPAFFFFLLFIISQGKWLGFGDVKLVFLMGIFLGFPKILPALFLTFFIGAIIGIGLIIVRVKKIKSEIPFGPFLITGAYLAMFWGQDLINWYLNLL